MTEDKNVPEAEITNSLGSLIDTLTFGAGSGMGGAGSPVSQLSTFFGNLRYTLVSNYRQTLSEMYVEHGIVQTLVDQPVDDAFRNGFEIVSEQLSQDEKEELIQEIERSDVMAEVKKAMYWARLFGGGALIIITKQDPMTPLDMDSIKDFSDIEFKSADMWELYFDSQNAVNIQNSLKPLEETADTEFYNYYGHKVHHSRVLIMKGKQAPSFIRPRLRGWGMSELERLVRSLNQYLKNQNVVFELLDEAKIDVYGITGFNEALLNVQGTDKIAQRVQMANQLKNYNNAITMDASDTYEQKAMTFTGLAEMLVQIRQGIASDLKIPITKLFGVSSTGFNSGEDDIENYNAMIETEIRSKSKHMLIKVVSLLAKKKFDFIPDDIMIKFPPLRMLSAEQEENVKNMKFNRVITAQANGLISPEEAKEALNADNLLPTEISEDDTLHENVGTNQPEF